MLMMDTPGLWQWILAWILRIPSCRHGSMAALLLRFAMDIGVHSPCSFAISGPSIHSTVIGIDMVSCRRSHSSFVLARV